MTRYIAVILLAWNLFPGMMMGQEISPAPTDSIRPAVGRVSFDGDGARFDVMLDSLRLGSTPISGMEIAAGRYVVTFVPAGRKWAEFAVVETLRVMPGDYVVRTIRPRRLIQLTTEPSGAEVTSGDSVIGTTPCFLNEIEFGKNLRISKPGFRSVPTSPGSFLSGTHTVLLPDESLSPPNIGTVALAPGDPSMTSVYITTAATVVAGVSAAYFKIKADGYYSDYVRTGDGATADKVRHYDVAAGISLAVSQIGMGILTYLLLTQ